MFSIELVRERSLDPVFRLKVSVYRPDVKVENADVEVIRRPPKVSFIYPDEMKNILSPVEMKKLELEMLNKVAEYLIENTDKERVKTTGSH